MTVNSKTGETRKPWRTPVVRKISSARDTRGGNFGQGNQDDTWYTVS
jgi:hypothetical protein